MVRKVDTKQRGLLSRDIAREQKNMMYLMNPAVSIDQEEAFFKYFEANSPSEDEVLLRMEQAKLEQTLLTPKPLMEHYDNLKRSGGWDKL